MEELDKEVKKLREDLQTLQKEKEKSDSGKVYSARSHTGTCIAFTSHSGIYQALTSQTWEYNSQVGSMLFLSQTISGIPVRIRFILLTCPTNLRKVYNYTLIKNKV